MTMPTFEPVAYMVETIHKVSGGKGTWISTDKSGWGNMVSVEYGKQESLFAESQLTAAYKTGLRDAVPELEALRIKVAAQAAVIEKLRKHSALLVEAYNFGQFADDFNQPQAHTIRKAIRETCEALAFPTDSKQVLEAFAAKVRNEAYEKAAVFCDLQQDEPECPERASYCAEAIRNLKELP